MQPTLVTLLTGFLGAGKTTLLNALLRDPAFSETAVLINEFGDVQIDHDLVAEFTDELVMTTTGCLCCTASSDIKTSLFDLWEKRQAGSIGPYRRVLVETTGLMDPVPAINSLLTPSAVGLIDHTVRRQFALSRVVTLFDVVNGPMTLDRHPEALKQIALADLVVFTKTDLASDPATLRDIVNDKQRIAAINPSATVLNRHADWSEISKLILNDATYDLRGKGDNVLDWLSAETTSSDHGHHHGHGDTHHHDHSHDHAHQDRNRHGDDIFSHVITLDRPVSRSSFEMFLDTVKANAGTDLLRLKGLIALEDAPQRPVVVHGVQHLIHEVDTLARWPNGDHRTKIVLIGRNLKIDDLRAALRSTT